MMANMGPWYVYIYIYNFNSIVKYCFDILIIYIIYYSLALFNYCNYYIILIILIIYLILYLFIYFNHSVQL